MTTPKQTPAQLLRRAEQAERQLQCEQIRAEKAWQSYGEALRDIVELKMRLEAIEKALRGDK
jgi:hypothetical protein